MELSFKKCTLDQLDDLLALQQIDDQPSIQNWLQGQAEIADIEKHMLSRYQRNLKNHVHDWNEVELLHHFIGPMFALVDISNRKFGLFAERPLEGVVDDIKLSGRPDGMIASGYRKPQKPYFCFQEYKRETDPDGDPAGQVLAAMLVAQEINEHKHSVYGCYVRGRNWFFITLEDKTYSISDGYIASRDDIFDIFRILKVLKGMISELMEKQA